MKAKIIIIYFLNFFYQHHGLLGANIGILICTNPGPDLLESHSSGFDGGDLDAHSREHFANVTLVLRIVGHRQCARREVSQKFRGIEPVITRIAASDQDAREGVGRAFEATASSQPVIARVLVQQDGKDSGDEYLVGEAIREIGAITLGVSHRALSIACFFVGALLDAGRDTGENESERIEVMLQQPELLAHAERCKRLVRIVDGVIVRNQVEHAVIAGRVICRSRRRSRGEGRRSDILARSASR